MPYTIALINTALGPALRRGRAEVLHPEVATRSDRHRPVRADPKPKLPRRDHDLHGLRNHLVALDPVRRQLRVDLRVLRPQHDQEGPLDVAASRLLRPQGPHRPAVPALASSPRTGHRADPSGDLTTIFAPPRRAVYDHKPTSDSARDAVGWAAAACRDPTSPPRPMQHIYRVMFGYLYGHLLNELQEIIERPEETDHVLRLGLHRLPITEFPQLRALAPALASYDGAAELDRGLDLLLPGLTATFTQPHRSPQPTSPTRTTSSANAAGSWGRPGPPQPPGIDQAVPVTTQKRKLR